MRIVGLRPIGTACICLVFPPALPPAFTCCVVNKCLMFSSPVAVHRCCASTGSLKDILSLSLKASPKVAPREPWCWNPTCSAATMKFSASVGEREFSKSSRPCLPWIGVMKDFIDTLGHWIAVEVGFIVKKEPISCRWKK